VHVQLLVHGYIIYLQRCVFSVLCIFNIDYWVRWQVRVPSVKIILMFYNHALTIIYTSYKYYDFYRPPPTQYAYAWVAYLYTYLIFYIYIYIYVYFNRERSSVNCQGGRCLYAHTWGVVSNHERALTNSTPTNLRQFGCMRAWVYNMTLKLLVPRLRAEELSFCVMKLSRKYVLIRDETNSYEILFRKKKFISSWTHSLSLANILVHNNKVW